MYLVSQRDNKKDITNISKTTRLKMILSNIFMLLAIMIDLCFIKKQAFKEGQISFIEVGVLMVYFFATQGYSCYKYYQTKNNINNKDNRIKEKEISIPATISWHCASFFKLTLIGICLSNKCNMYISTYFTIRLTIYCSALLMILSHLRQMNQFVLVKGELLTQWAKHGKWMLDKFWIIFYSSIIGINLDVIALGNSTNYYFWVVLMSIFVLYLLNKLVRQNIKSNILKSIFESE